METFLGWVLESSLLIVMILGIRKVFMGKIRYSLICALWMIVFLRFLIPVNFISTPFSVGNKVGKVTSAWKLADKKGRSAQTADDSDRTDGQIGAGDKDRLSNLHYVGMMTENQISAGTEDGYSDNVLSGQGGIGAAIAAVRSFVASTNWWFAAKCVWAVGSILLFFWLVLSNVLLIRKLKRGRTAYGAKEGVFIYTSDDISNPCLYGFWKPVIYLPRNVVAVEGEGGLGQEEIEQIITHEYVHYRHRDYLWAILRMVLLSVYWFNPLLWLAISCSKKDAEMYCDETVVRLLGEDNRFSYGEMLVRLAGTANWSDFRYSMMSMSKNGKEMERRIRAISGSRRYSKWYLVPLAAAVSVAVAVTCSTGIAPSVRAQKKIEDSHSRTNVGDGKQTKQDEREGTNQQEAVGEFREKKQLSLYDDFLREQAGDVNFRYYSLASLRGEEEEHLVLLVSSKTEGMDTQIWGSNDCRVYHIVNDKVTLCGTVTCGSQEWLRLSGGKIMTASRTTAPSEGTTQEYRTIHKTWLGAGLDELHVETVSELASGRQSGMEGQDTADAGDELAEYEQWEQEFAQVLCVAFYQNPYTAMQTEGEPMQLSLQNDKAAYLSDEAVTLVYSSTCQEAFGNYMECFTEAVNTGDTRNMYIVLDEKSEVYAQQCMLAKNYYKRGIREEILSCSIASAKQISSEMVEIESRESIKVYYADKTSKVVKQRYCYTCVYGDHGWIITKMVEAKNTK